MSARPEILFSTDIAGLTAHPDAIASVYDDSLAQLATIGHDQPQVELIAWRHNYQTFIHQAQQHGYQVHGLHGSIGHPPKESSFSDKGMFTLFRSLIAPTDQLIPVTVDLNLGYLLVHESEINGRLPAAQLFPSSSTPPYLFLENNPWPGSLDRALTKVHQLRSEQAPSGIMVDLLHLLKESPHYSSRTTPQVFDPLWDQALTHAAQTLDQSPIAAIHLPIGLNDDSLPVYLMKPYHWEDLAALIQNFSDRIYSITLENQHQQTQFSLSSSMAKKLAWRNTQIIRRLIQTGVLV